MRFLRKDAYGVPVVAALLLALATGGCDDYDHREECSVAISARSDELLEFAAQIADAETNISDPICDTTVGPPPWVGLDFGSVKDAEASGSRIPDLDYATERVTAAGFIPGEYYHSRAQRFDGPDAFFVIIEQLDNEVSVTVWAPDPES